MLLLVSSRKIVHLYVAFCSRMLLWPMIHAEASAVLMFWPWCSSKVDLIAVKIWKHECTVRLHCDSERGGCASVQDRPLQ